MSVLIMIRGNSGSGKTSVAQKLQKKLGRNTLLISQDVIRREMLWVKDGKNTKALPLLLTLLDYGKEHCQHVILEGILDADCYKPLFKHAKEIFGDRIYAYYYRIPFAETLRRYETRKKKEEFGEAEMLRWWMEDDFIGLIPEKIFLKDKSLDEAVEEIYGDIMQEGDMQ